MKKTSDDKTLFFGLAAIILFMLYRSKTNVVISNIGSLRERK